MDRWIKGTKPKKKILFILNENAIFSYKGYFVQSKCSSLNSVFNTSKLIFMRCVRV